MERRNTEIQMKREKTTNDTKTKYINKSKTIEKYLGKDYRVVSSKGHVCDLATSGKEGLGIDVDHDFEPKYKISKERDFRL